MRLHTINYNIHELQPDDPDLTKKKHLKYLLFKSILTIISNIDERLLKIL